MGRVSDPLRRAGKHLGKQCRIADRAGKDARLIEARDSSSAPVRGSRPCVGLKRPTTPEGGGADHRAVGLRADRARHISAATAAAEPKTIRPACDPCCADFGLARIEVGYSVVTVLRGSRPCPRSPPTAPHRGAACVRPTVSIRFPSACRVVEDILDGRARMQGPMALPCLRRSSAISACSIAWSRRGTPMLDIAIDFVDALEAVADELHRAERPSRMPAAASVSPSALRLMRTLSAA